MVADFDELMTQARDALDQIAKGNPDGYKALYSREEDITLGNPFGGFGRGVAAVYDTSSSSVPRPTTATARRSLSRP